MYATKYVYYVRSRYYIIRSVHNKMKWFQQCDIVKKEDKLHILLPLYCLLQSCRDYNKSR